MSRIVGIDCPGGRIVAKDGLAGDNLIPLGKCGQGRRSSARGIVRIIAVALRRQHGSIGVHEAHAPTVTTIFHIRVTPDTTRPGNPVGDPGLGQETQNDGQCPGQLRIVVSAATA